MTIWDNATLLKVTHYASKCTQCTIWKYPNWDYWLYYSWSTRCHSLSQNLLLYGGKLQLHQVEIEKSKSQFKIKQYQRHCIAFMWDHIFSHFLREKLLFSCLMLVGTIESSYNMLIDIEQPDHLCSLGITPQGIYHRVMKQAHVLNFLLFHLNCQHYGLSQTYSRNKPQIMKRQWLQLLCMNMFTVWQTWRHCSVVGDEVLTCRACKLRHKIRWQTCKGEDCFWTLTASVIVWTYLLSIWSHCPFIMDNTVLFMITILFSKKWAFHMKNVNIMVDRK